MSNSNCIRATSDVKPVKVRRSSRLARLSDTGTNEVTVKTSNLDPGERDKISECQSKLNKRSARRMAHEVVSCENVTSTTGGLKSKRRKVGSCRPSASSSYCDGPHDHARIFSMHVASPFDVSKYTVGFSSHDKCTKGDVLQAPEYVCDIFQRLFKIEVSNRNSKCVVIEVLPCTHMSQDFYHCRQSCRTNHLDCIRRWMNNQNLAQQCA